MSLVHETPGGVDFEVCLTRDKLIVVRVRCVGTDLVAELNAEDARTLADTLNKCADMSERRS